MAAPLTDDRALRARGLFVAEGRFVVERLLARAAWRTTALYLTPAARAALDASLDALPDERRPPVHVMSAAELDAAGGFTFHQGCLAHAERPAASDVEAVIEAGAGRGPIVVLDSVRDPDNVGAIFRNASAFGAAAVLLGPGCADPLYRKTVRTSMAAVFAVPFAVAASLTAVIDALDARGVETLALTPAGDAELLPVVAATRGAGAATRTAVIAGAEDTGLSGAVLARARRRLRVPMAAGVDSLNVATAVGVSLYALAHARPDVGE